MPDPRLGPGEVVVRVRRVGLCATDAEIGHGAYGMPPEGEPLLILGHENLGVIEAVGADVQGWSTGDLVVSTVRRPCGLCPNCNGGENDLCSSGLYTERGIMRRHGFMAEYYAESPAYLHRIPESVADTAVLLEPMSVVEKAIDHLYLLQRRMIWQPQLAMVLGAGPIGLLAASILRLRGLRTVVVGREGPTDLRAQIAVQLGAEYVSAERTPVLELPRTVGDPDLIVEATGSSQVAFDAMQIIGLNGIVCLVSVTIGSLVREVPIDAINQRLMIGNRTVFGSVNANPRHFARGVEDLVAVERRWPGVLGRLITARLPWHDYRQWFFERGPGIKTTLEIA